ncbi:type II secretion system F family protein [Svornostia abyssi]|uniref:Type II secretion system F family protein n=1 Tax=Svornostia abyssi TaxID=2898438 RepID=A0ABY5PDA5_9ACTN|nr:type II secretion system F family protein [Parviterribacteraceae bacterium J379]
MSTFTYTVVDSTGSQSKGEVEAETLQSVTDQLRQRGLIVLNVGEKKQSKEIELPWTGRIKSADLTIMTRQLSTMVSSGMSILRALNVLERQTENEKLKKILATVRRNVESGVPLSDALERHPEVFNPLYVSMVRAGETGGVLESSLHRVADQLEKDDALRRQIKSAMVYPTVIVTFAIIVLLGLVTFLVPVFAGIFKQFDGELPMITRFTVGMSDLITGRWYLILAGTIAAVWGFRRWKSSENGRRQWQRFCLRIPMKIGDIVQKVALARWSRTLSALLAAGVPLLQALEITGKTAGNVVVEDAMDDIRASVRSGGSISAPMKTATIFPPMVTHMVGVGEETGALDTMLSKIADFYEDQVAAAVKSLTSILEPVMLVVVGGIVGFVVIAMYLPMFKLYDQIK